jgi:hypothetical protein
MQKAKSKTAKKTLKKLGPWPGALQYPSGVTIPIRVTMKGNNLSVHIRQNGRWAKYRGPVGDIAIMDEETGEVLKTYSPA